MGHTANRDPMEHLPRSLLLRFLPALIALNACTAHPYRGRTPPTSRAPVLAMSGPASAEPPETAPASPSSGPPLPAGVVVAAGWTLAALAQGFGGPDDLYASSEGILYFSDIQAGEVGLVRTNGPTRPTSVASGLSVPEGLAQAPDGSLLVVEQGRNRIDRIDPATGAVTPWRTLQNPTSLEGVDNITATPQGLLVPDSPLGRLLLLPWDGGSLRVLATGMTRPTSVWPGAAGTLYLTDETGNALVALPGGGAPPRRLTRLDRPDDVVGGPGDTLLVACLDGSVRQVDPATGEVRTIVSGLGAPQGLTADGTGYAVSDEAGNRIYRLEGQK